MRSESILFSLVAAYMVVSCLAEETTCHYKFGSHPPEQFDLFTCYWCYFYLFTPAEMVFHQSFPWIVRKTDENKFQKLLPNTRNETNRKQICSSLSDDDCERWLACCASAHDCCDKQRLTPPNNDTCRPTWDGYSCWEQALPGTEHYTNCPLYIKNSLPTRLAKKTCLANGTWYKKDGHYWTDYTPCTDVKDLKTSLYIGLSCSIISLVVLLPAIFIFVTYKSLRKQHRIRLHVNFFVSMALKELMTILWDILITYDQISASDSFNTVLVSNGAGCKILSFLKIYFQCTSYTWMFCEGFYLHRLMSNAFSPPRSLKALYFSGWCFPLVYTIIYAIIRGVKANDSCWSQTYGATEWIFYTPNLACLVVNFIFLCNILRILLTQLQSHPNEPNNFRKAVKATFVLIPLFGVQLFVTIYRYPLTSVGGVEYERFSLFVKNMQGFFVALIFCFLNGEVRGEASLRNWFIDKITVIAHLRRTWRRRIWDRSNESSKRQNITNQTITLNTDTMLDPKHSFRDRKELYQMRENANGCYGGDDGECQDAHGLYDPMLPQNQEEKDNSQYT